MAVSLHIPEYFEGCELVAAEDLAGQPAFWLAHLLMTVGDPGEDPRHFGVDAVSYEHMVERLGDPEEPWPVLRVPMAGGQTAYVVYANFEDTNDVDFFVRHPDRSARPPRPVRRRRCRSGSVLEGTHGPGSTRGGRACRPGRQAAAAPAAPSDARGRGDTTGGPQHGDEGADPLWAEWQGGGPAAGDPPAGDLEAGRGPRWSTTADSPLAVCASPHSPRRVPLALRVTPDQAQALADALG